MLRSDTIAAIATPPGKGGIGIVRVSGEQVLTITQAIISRELIPRIVTYTHFYDYQGDSIDSGVAILYRQPHSYTGEDVLELQGHGGPVVMDVLLERVLELGARPARAGEFSERAFLNEKFDLAQAEAVADIIEASSRQAARLAQRSLQGHFSSHINRLCDELTELRAFIEAGIDFPDEELELLQEGDVRERIKRVLLSVDETLDRATQGRLLHQGIRVVLAGEPNVGKSSLLNAIVGYRRAIVTDRPGTTRDTIDEPITLHGVGMTLTDTAGLRESDDPVEMEGITHAHSALERADVVLFVRDATRHEKAGVRNDPLLSSLMRGVPVLSVCNKVDLLSFSPEKIEDFPLFLSVSAKTGQGIDTLCQAILHSVGFEQTGEDLFMARRRHIKALQSTREAINQASVLLEKRQGLELVAEELRLGTETLGEITGEFTSEALLDQIFSQFCIGK